MSPLFRPARLAFCLLSLCARAEPVSLVFAGDIVLDGQPGQFIAQGRDPFAAFAKLIDSADIRVGNLECVVATVGEPEEKTLTSAPIHVP